MAVKTPIIMNAILQHLIALEDLTEQCDNGNPTTVQRTKIDNLRAELPVNILRRFDHLTKHGRLPVVPLSESGACGSCHLKLPPADVLRIRSSSHALPVCPFCGCFLYASAAVEEQNEMSVIAT